MYTDYWLEKKCQAHSSEPSGTFMCSKLSASSIQEQCVQEGRQAAFQYPLRLAHFGSFRLF